MINELYETKEAAFEAGKSVGRLDLDDWAKKRIADLEAALAEIHSSATRGGFAVEWYFGGVRTPPGDYVLMRVGPVTSDETPF